MPLIINPRGRQCVEPDEVRDLYSGAHVGIDSMSSFHGTVGMRKIAYILMFSVYFCEYLSKNKNI